MIRRAVISDCPSILTLIKELAVFEKAPNEVSVTLAEMQSAGFGENPVWWAFVHENEHKQIDAFALYYIRYSTWKGNRMYLEDILVTENARGKGIGTLLMNQLIEEAKTKELKGIVWQVLDWNEKAIQFYQNYASSFDSEWINCSLTTEQINSSNASI
jgi:GNAT superfamily N-acetyltransferase